MGVKGDPNRVSTLVVREPYMGLVPGTRSWAEPTYNHTFVNSCWELYGSFGNDTFDHDHYPATGSHYDMKVVSDVPNMINWTTHWTENEKPDCPLSPDGSKIA